VPITQVRATNTPIKVTPNYCTGRDNVLTTIPIGEHKDAF
jgi:hypothetical protein